MLAAVGDCATSFSFKYLLTPYWSVRLATKLGSTSPDCQFLAIFAIFARVIVQIVLKLYATVIATSLAIRYYVVNAVFLHITIYNYWFAEL